jgi:hypothetical protein
MGMKNEKKKRGEIIKKKSWFVSVTKLMNNCKQ